MCCKYSLPLFEWKKWIAWGYLQKNPDSYLDACRESYWELYNAGTLLLPKNDACYDSGHIDGYETDKKDVVVNQPIIQSKF